MESDSSATGNQKLGSPSGSLFLQACSYILPVSGRQKIAPLHNEKDSERIQLTNGRTAALVKDLPLRVAKLITEIDF